MKVDKEEYSGIWIREKEKMFQLNLFKKSSPETFFYNVW